MWFQPERAERPFSASVPDIGLLEKVNELNAQPDALVRATFDRYNIYRSGSQATRGRVTYLLTSIATTSGGDVELDL